MNSVVRLTVDNGKPFAIQTTKYSFGEMGLYTDTVVLLACKVSNVQVI